MTIRAMTFTARRDSRRSWSAKLPLIVRTTRCQSRIAGLYLRIGWRCWGFVRVPAVRYDLPAGREL